MTLGGLVGLWDRARLEAFVHYHDGLCSMDLDGEPLIVPNDIVIFSATLKLLFGDTYLLTDPMTEDEHLTGTAKLVWDILINDGWSRGRFYQALDVFKRQKFYGNNAWKPFDFLQCSPQPDLHDYEWVRREVEVSPDAMSRMMHREVAGMMMWGYR